MKIGGVVTNDYKINVFFIILKLQNKIEIVKYLSSVVKLENEIHVSILFINIRRPLYIKN